MRLISYLSPGFPATLFEIVGSAIGAEVLFETSTSGPRPGEDPFRDGSFDLGWICATSFVDLALRHDPSSVQLAGVGWVPDDPGVRGRPEYFGDVVVSGGTAASLLDLRGRRIGCNDAISLSGHLSLRWALEALGERPDEFADLVFTGSHHASLDRVLSGELDACVVDSVVRTSRSRRDAAVANLRVLDRLGPWPVQPLVARRDLEQDRLGEVRDTILRLNGRPDVRTILDASGLTGFVPVEPDHYRPVALAFERHVASTASRDRVSDSPERHRPN